MASVTDASMAVLATSAGEPGLASESVFVAMLDELAWFAAGYLVVLVLMHLGLLPRFQFLTFPALSSRLTGEGRVVQRRAAMKALCASAAAGQNQAVLEAWDKEKARGPFPVDALQDVAQALATCAPGRLTVEVTAHLAKYPGAYAQPKTLHAVLETVLQSGRPDLAAHLAAAVQHRLGIKGDQRARELMKVTAEAKKAAPAADGAAPRSPASTAARGHVLAVKTLLDAGDLEAAVQSVAELAAQGLEVPPRAILALARWAAGAGPQAVAQLLDGLQGKVRLPTESAALLLNDCLRRSDAEGARRLDAAVQAQGGPMPFVLCEPLLKLYASACEPCALELLRDMQKDGVFASEGLCGNLLARCADAKNVRLAEAIADYLRGRSMMSLAIFKTLMKVYDYCGRYDSACDLYEEVLAAGLQPDHIMYSCLVKFAVKCGRTALSQELFNKANGGDIQNYMWLIRAAGRDGDADRAVKLLRDLEAQRPGGLDAAIYNCALDACVTAGAGARARELLAEMVAAGLANLVSYNTLLKGYCAQGDLGRAREALRDMARQGLAPDSASYNCLLGALVNAERLREVWELVDEMRVKDVPLDHYTVSIVMKAAKKAKGPRDAERAMSVLDCAMGANICEDDVVFNTVLDACISRRDTERLMRVLKAFQASSLKPSVHTYGLLIKAFSMLRQPARCWQLWEEMVGAREIAPNQITLSCMLDAAISAGQVEEALALFREWRAAVPPNTIIFSTLIKGFAAASDAGRAMEMYRELRKEGLQMNLVAYTSLIDAHARAGDVAQAKQLFLDMQKDGCQPNVITYSALVKGHCLQGDMDEALSLFRSMLKGGLAADSVIFNTLLDGCVKHSRFDLADSLLAEMPQLGVQPSNFTTSIVVKMWGKRRRLDRAFEAVRASVREGRTLDLQVGNCLVSACFYNQAPSRALEALAEVKSWQGCERPAPPALPLPSGARPGHEGTGRGCQPVRHPHQRLGALRRGPQGRGGSHGGVPASPGAAQPHEGPRRRVPPGPLRRPRASRAAGRARGPAGAVAAAGPHAGARERAARRLRGSSASRRGCPAAPGSGSGGRPAAAAD